MAFSGTPAQFPASYAAPIGVKLEDRTGSVLVATPDTWTQATVSFVVPVNARYLVMSPYAFENVEDDATDPEFDGHLVDDAVLMLRSVP